MDLFAPVEWLARAHRLVPPSEAAVLLSPPLLAARFLAFAAARRFKHAGISADDIRARDPEFIALMMDFFRGFGELWFRPRFEGIENIPPEGAALLVGNHDGGLVPVQGFLTGLAIYDRFAGERAMYVLVHDFILHDPLLRKYALRLGMLRAHDDSAHQVFAEGHTLLVYPGSDLDTFRPFRERGKVVLGERRGFISCALKHGVPIVPVVSAGSHEQFIVLTRGDGIARAFGMHAWARTVTFPLVLAMPWGLTTGFLPYLPLPAQITLSFLPPMRWPQYGPEQAHDADVLERCARDVHEKMQRELDRLMQGRRFLLGQARA